MTSNNVSDAAVIPDLLQQLPQDELLHSLTGDGAYDTQSVYEALMEAGATTPFTVGSLIAGLAGHTHAASHPSKSNDLYNAAAAILNRLTELGRLQTAAET